MGVEVEDGLVNNSLGNQEVNMHGCDLGGNEILKGPCIGNQYVAEIKNKKSRSFRKKSRIQKSPSPLGQERPKKRAREGEDIFDIDRFIFALNREDQINGVDPSVEVNRESFMTPDLNEAEPGMKELHEGISSPIIVEEKILKDLKIR
ncbi:hypothetical protein Hanom_Chr08g00702361 [Helianthus anomalus]